MFRNRVDYYDTSDFAPSKLMGTILLGGINFYLFVQALSPHLTEKVTPYDGFIISSFFASIISLIASYFSVNYLVNLLVASYESLDSQDFKRDKNSSLSFSFDTLYNMTLKNPIFYFFSLSFGHFAGIFERYSVFKNIHQFTDSWDVTLVYYFTYLKYPILTFFIGILVISLVYLSIVLFQNSLIRFLDASGVPEIIHAMMTTWSYYANKKAFVMTLFGFLPGATLMTYCVGVLPESVGLFALIKTYGVTVLFAYLLVPLLFTVYDALKSVKFTKEKTSDTETTIDGETVKTKQTSYEEIETISISNYMDADVREAIQEINNIVMEINPYLKLTDIEEAHVLKRITEVEILNLIKHYNKLPGDTKEEVKQVLLEQLHNARKAAEEIAQVSKKFHYEAFQKQASLMDARYKEKKDAN